MLLSTVAISQQVVATGGTTSIVGGYKYHVFSSSDSFKVTSGGAVEVLVVGGGGGGGGAIGGGGGAGGVLYQASYTVAASNMAVTVGAGGAGGAGYGLQGQQGTHGGSSSFGTLLANGGGGGGNYGPTGTSFNNAILGDGGSGGGGSYNNGAVNSHGIGTAGQGNDGGLGNNPNGDYGAGGGGAGAKGQDAPSNVGGKGGDGLYFAQFTNAGSPAGWFGGGGGGGGRQSLHMSGGAGGQGGGGKGSLWDGPCSDAAAGIDNTGGGGGAGGSNGCSGPTSGAYGGYGIVIVRYPYRPAPVINSSLSVSGTKGSAFSYSISAANNPSGYSASNLPSGLSLNSSTGVISGTPTLSGVFTVPISATNASGTGPASLTLTIGSIPTIISSTSTTSTIGTNFSYSVAATDNPISYSATSLPTGLSINSTTGLISGNSTTTGTFHIPITATNLFGTSSVTDFAITILPIYASTLWNYNPAGVGTILPMNTANSVGIGTSSTGPYQLAVEGTIAARKLKITQANPWADFVFDDNYHLPSIDSIENYIKAHKHLPDVPSAQQVKSSGIDVGDTQAVLLRKIEELTLYMIEQEKHIQQLEAKISQAKK